MRLERFEVELLHSVREALRRTLEGQDPHDPVIERLFPPTVLGDEESDADLRSMIHDDLLRDRLAGLDALVELLDRGTTRGGALQVDLVEEEPLLVLGVLNDVRLAVGARIGIEHVDRAAVDRDDPLAYHLAVMDHLGLLQEQLLEVLDPPSSNVYEQEDL